MMTLFPVFSRKVAYALEMKGFKVVNIAPNRKREGFKVYYFEETLALRRAAQEIIQEIKKS